MGGRGALVSQWSQARRLRRGGGAQRRASGGTGGVGKASHDDSPSSSIAFGLPLLAAASAFRCECRLGSPRLPAALGQVSHVRLAFPRCGGEGTLCACGIWKGPLLLSVSHWTRPLVCVCRSAPLLAGLRSSAGCCHIGLRRGGGRSICVPSALPLSHPQTHRLWLFALRLRNALWLLRTTRRDREPGWTKTIRRLLFAKMEFISERPQRAEKVPTDD